MRNFQIFIIFIFLLKACGTQTIQSTAPLIPDLKIQKVFPEILLNGTTVTIEGDGFVPENIGSQIVILNGTAGEKPVSVQIDAFYISQKFIGFSATEELFKFIPVDSAPFKGTISVERILKNGEIDKSSISVSFQAVSNLQPILWSIFPVEIYLDEILQISGDNFLLKGEGVSLLVLNGQFLEANAYTSKSIVNIYLPGKSGDRKTLNVKITPDIFGINSGTFKGEIKIINDTGKNQIESNTLSSLQLNLLETFLSKFDPVEIRRGQSITFEGKGFVETQISMETSTLITFRGEFKKKRGGVENFSKNNPLIFFPDEIIGNYNFRTIIRVTIDLDGNIGGLGHEAGVLNGLFQPWIIFGSDILEGSGINGTLTILPQRQVVFVKFLPQFSETLSHFGLLAVEEEIKKRILEVVRTDYTGINIDFRMERPADFVEYSVIEVGGKDPNNAGLLGLDNTLGKDVGNLIFDDVLGGYNAEREEQGNFAYGGVFAESFFNFSPSLSSFDKEMTSPKFDEIFSPFCPMLGGEPVSAGEYPDGKRSEKISLAIKTLGNLIGDTISHEIGHSLGLTAIEGEIHNIGDNPGWIMDAGIYRPFEERSQLSGAHKRVFAPFNYNYLKSVLPVD